MKIFNDPIGNQTRDLPVLISTPWKTKYMGEKLIEKMSFAALLKKFLCQLRETYTRLSMSVCYPGFFHGRKRAKF
jgi:hypothetical protein